jgi:hypothetical protein
MKECFMHIISYYAFIIKLRILPPEVIMHMSTTHASIICVKVSFKAATMTKLHWMRYSSAICRRGVKRQ